MSNMINILKFFLDEPNREFNVREIARIAKISPTTASKKLKEYSKQDFLKKRKERIYDLYKANIESEKYRDLKTYHNICSIKESGLIQSLNNFYLKPTIILFGSYSNGYDTQNSDIDLVIISEKTKEFNERKKYERILKHELQLHILRDISELSNEHLINNILNGIIIQGDINWMSMNVSKKALLREQK